MQEAGSSGRCGPVLQGPAPTRAPAPTLQGQTSVLQVPRAADCPFSPQLHPSQHLPDLEGLPGSVQGATPNLSEGQH